MLNRINELSELLSMFSLAIPEGTDTSINVDGAKITLVKNEDGVKISVESIDEKFDDSEIKQRIKEYKEFCDELDDCLFVDSLEEIKEYVDLVEFDKLLNLEVHTEESAKNVEEMINISENIMSAHIESKIEDLTEILNKING